MTELFFGVKCATGNFYTHVEKFGFTIEFLLDDDGNQVKPPQPVGLVGCHLSGPWRLPDKLATPTLDPDTEELVYPDMDFDFYNIFVVGDLADTMTSGFDQTEDDPDNPGEQRIKEVIDRTTVGMPGSGMVKRNDKDNDDPKKPMNRNTIGGGPGLQFEIYEGSNGPRNPVITPANIFWR